MWKIKPESLLKIIFLLLALNYIPAKSLNYEDVQLACAERAGLNIEEVYDLNSLEENSIDHKFKCYHNCVLEYAGTMREATFLYTETRERMAMKTNELTRAIWMYILDSCEHSIDGIEDPCEAAYQLEICFNEANNEQARLHLFSDM